MYEIKFCQGQVYIFVDFNNQKTPALVDSGAARSLISHNISRKSIGEKDSKNIPILKGITGEKLNVLGKMEDALIKIKKKSVMQEFLIVKHLKEEIILGQDFLTKNKVVLDFKGRTLNIEGTVVPLCITDNEHKQWSLKTKEKASINGLGVVECGVWQGTKERIDLNGWFGVKPDAQLWGEPEEGDWQELYEVEVINGVCYIPVINEIKDSVLEFPTGTSLGQVTPMIHIFNTMEDTEMTEKSRTEKLIESLNIEENENLSTEQKVQLTELIEEFKHLFALDRSELGYTNLTEHEIPLTTDKPVQCPYRRVPFRLAKFVEEEIKSLLEANIISYSNSSFNSPSILLRKNEKQRLIVDFRELNKISKRSYAAIPSIDTLISNWAGCSLFSSIDFKDSYYQIPIKEEDKHKTGFAIPGIGHFHFDKMPLGLAGAPATYQSLLDKLLAGLKTDVATNFIDDILTGSKTVEQMISNLREVFTRLEASGLKLNPKKCELCKNQLKFLGVLLSANGVECDPEKTKAVREMKMPQTRKQVQRLLGAANWFRNHIPEYAKHAKGVTDVLRGKTFKMTKEAEESVEKLKECLINPPLLIFPNLEEQFILYTDASLTCLGGVIGQLKDGAFMPIAYGSKVLSKTEQAYESFKRELLSLKHFIEHWRYYLAYGRFKAYVDMEALCGHNFLKKSFSAVLLRWMQTMAAYDFELIHKKGSQMNIPDWLSRPILSSELVTWYKKRHPMAEDIKNDEEEEYIVNTVEITEGVEEKSSHKQDTHSKAEGTWENPLPAIRDTQGYWRNAQRNDVELKTVIQWVVDNARPDRKIANAFGEGLKKLWNNFNRLIMNKEGVPCFKYYSNNSEKVRALIIVPKLEKENIFKAFHDSETSGHMSFNSTLQNIRSKYYWPKMTTETKHYCEMCETCFINNQAYRRKPKCPMRVFPSGYPNQCIAIDLFGPFVKKKNAYKYILTIMCRYTRFLQAVPLMTATSQEIAHALIDNWFFRWGIPDALLSDQGANLVTSELMKELYQLLNIDKRQTTAYRPQTNGMIERKHRDIANVIKKLVGDNPENWKEKLIIAVFAINMAICRTTGYSPYQLMLSYNIRGPSDLIFDTTTSIFYKSQQHLRSVNFQRFRDIFDQVRNNISDSLEIQKRTYDRQANFTRYKVGDLVLLYRPLLPQIKEYKNS